LILLLFSGVPSLELPEVKTTVGSARSRTVGAALFPAVALRDLCAANKREFVIESQTNWLKEVAATRFRRVAAAGANEAFTEMVRAGC
jgi:hypothetical protein